SSNITEVPLTSLDQNDNPVEPQVTVNPTNPRMVAVSSQNFLEVSADGGKTFSNRATFPLPAGSSRAGDTSTVFDSKGQLFWANLVNPGTGDIALYVAQVLVDISGTTPKLTF